DLADAHARGVRLDRAGSNVNAGDLREEYADVSLLCLELTDRRRDLGRREDRRGHLIEQRLKYVVGTPVDQYDLDVGVPQCSRTSTAAGRCEGRLATPGDRPPMITTRLRSRRGASTTAVAWSRRVSTNIALMDRLVRALPDSFSNLPFGIALSMSEPFGFARTSRCEHRSE